MRNLFLADSGLSGVKNTTCLSRLLTHSENLAQVFFYVHIVVLAGLYGQMFAGIVRLSTLERNAKA